MITRYTQYVNEVLDTTGENSQIEVAKKRIENDISAYNSKKGQFKSIFSKKPQDWEEAASKLIDENPYLSIQWRIDKLAYQLDAVSKMPIPQDDEARKKAEEDKRETQKQLNELKKELDERRKNDLNSIKN